jgi:hypothetical protein
MANAFGKEEIIFFNDTLVKAFEDNEVVSNLVGKFETDQTKMARTGDTFWMAAPYIATSYDGLDQTANYNQITQLQVPGSIDQYKSTPFYMDVKEMRDALQAKSFGKAQVQKLASDINLSVANSIAKYGANVVKRTGTPTGFDDIAPANTLMSETGVSSMDNILAMAPKDYNSVAGNLAGRGTMTGKPATAYERAYIGSNIAGFEAYRMDFGITKAAALGSGITIDTRASASNYLVPKAMSTATTGQTSPYDNRFQTITVSSTTSVAAQDSFTIAGIYNVHQITKQSTGSLKTFRVVSVDSSTTMTITPPLITAQGGAPAEVQYQNCTATTTASNAAIVWLNTALAPYNLFWQKDAVKLIPGEIALPNSGDGLVGVMKTTTSSGVQLAMVKEFNSLVMKYFIRVDAFYGVCNAAPEQSGIILMNQT